MMSALKQWVAGVCADFRDIHLPLLLFSLRMLAGRRWWLIPPLMSFYSGFQALRLLMGWKDGVFEAVSAQTVLIGFPLMILAIGLGTTVIAGEIEDRTLEISFTVPGGIRRVMLPRLGAAFVLLLLSEMVLATWCELLFLPLRFSMLYGALQEAVFYLVVAMGLAVWSRSKLSGAMLTAVLFAVNLFATGFGTSPLRISPTFNPLALEHRSPGQVLAFTVQNRIGIAILLLLLVFMILSRAGDRERMLQ